MENLSKHLTRNLAAFLLRKDFESCRGLETIGKLKSSISASKTPADMFNVYSLTVRKILIYGLFELFPLVVSMLNVILRETSQ